MPLLKIFAGTTTNYRQNQTRLCTNVKRATRLVFYIAKQSSIEKLYSAQ